MGALGLSLPMGNVRLKDFKKAALISEASGAQSRDSNPDNPSLPSVLHNQAPSVSKSPAGSHNLGNWKPIVVDDRT